MSRILLQVNHSPSFNIDTPLDARVKGALVADTLRLVRCNPVALRNAQKVHIFTLTDATGSLDGTVTMRHDWGHSSLMFVHMHALSHLLVSAACMLLAHSLDEVAVVEVLECVQRERQATLNRLQAKTQASVNSAPPADAITPPDAASSVRSGACAPSDGAALRRRLAFETKNIGNYERVYPLQAKHASSTGGATPGSGNSNLKGRALAEEFEACAKAAEECFEGHHSKRMRNHLDGIAARHKQAKVRCLPIGLDDTSEVR